MEEESDNLEIITIEDSGKPKSIKECCLSTIYKAAIIKYSTDQLQNMYAFPVEKGRKFPEILEFDLIGPIIYAGDFSSASQKAILKNDDSLCLIKTVPANYNKLPKEIKLLRKLEHHVNVTQLMYYSYNIFRSNVHMILEAMNSTLRDEMNQSEPIPMIYIKVYLFQLFKGIGHLHSHKICHKNIKPENIFVDNQTRFLKITNFDRSEKLDNGGGKCCCFEISIYKAPELLLLCNSYNLSIDIWSAGCIVGEMLNKCVPLIKGENNIQIYRSLRELLGTPTLSDIRDMGFPEEVFYRLVNRKMFSTLKEKCTELDPVEYDILEMLLKYNPSRRPTALSVLEHHFFSILRDPSITYPNGDHLPDLFKFTEWELEVYPQLEWICSNYT